MKALIIEDEYLNYQYLCDLMRKVRPDCELSEAVTSVENLYEALRHQKDFDIIFCDIRLDDGLCFDVLQDIEITTPIVFTTGYDDYAMKAFEVGGVDYLLKPISADKLKTAIERAMKMKRGAQDLSDLLQQFGAKPSQGKYATRLLVNVFDGSCVLNISDINHIAYEDLKVKAYLNDGSSLSLTDKTIDAIFARLNPAQFFRVNRQYIVNIECIERIHKWFHQKETIEMRVYKDLRISVSKEMVSALHEWIER